MIEYRPYNPLDKINLGKSVAEALLESEVYPLGTLKPFIGAGIYAIYYAGDFEAYRLLSEKNRGGLFEIPIYVGEAVPRGARKGSFGLDVDPGTALYSRLRQHFKSITQAENLHIEDFFCRFLVVEDIWIPLGEALLIAKFSPIWNTHIDGFGNHDPGKGRHAGARPKWDTLHPGREWANKCAERPETPEQIADEIKSCLRGLD